MIYWIIYIIGYIVAYYMMRKEGREILGAYYDWEEVAFQLALSFLSWAIVLTYICKSTKLPEKPPKWL